MKIDLIGVPVNYGCDREGAQYGPKILRDNNIEELIRNEGHELCDKGNIDVPFADPKEKYEYHKNLKYLKPIVEYNNNLAEAVYNSLMVGAMPFVLGGDHSLGMGSIAGTSKYFNEIAVIWIDAHADINTEYTSPSGNIHGMPLAASMNVGNKALTDIYFRGQKVKPENVYILGARDIDPGEYKLAEETKINLFTMDTIREEGLDRVLNIIVSKINESNVDGVHLSFDIDALDSSLVPGTGTPVSGGFVLKECKDIFTYLIKNVNISTIDFVEFNPVIDVNNETLKICFDILKHIFRTFKQLEENLVKYAI